MKEPHVNGRRAQSAAGGNPPRAGVPVRRLVAALAFTFATVMSTIALSASPAGAANVAFGSTVNASISTPGETDTYYVTAKSGNRLSLDRINGSSSLRTRLVAPNGAVIWSGNTPYTDRFVDLTQTGTYRLIISYGTHAYTGAYSFALNNVASPQRFYAWPTCHMSVGILNIEVPGASDSYHFRAVAGDRLSFDRISGSSSLRTRLVAPNGAVIWSGNTVFADRFVNLTQTGIYRLIISYGASPETGKYNLKITGVTQPPYTPIICHHP